MKKAEKKISQVENQSFIFSKDMEDIKWRCQSLRKAIDTTEADFVQCFDKAEKANDMSIVIKGNSLKQSSEKAKAKLKLLKEQ